MKILVLKFWKRPNFDAFFRPSTLKTKYFSTKIQGQAMCAQRNCLIPFSIWVMGGGRITPPPMRYGSGKSPMAESVQRNNQNHNKFSRLFMLQILFKYTVYKTWVPLCFASKPRRGIQREFKSDISCSILLSQNFKFLQKMYINPEILYIRTYNTRYRN